MDPRHRSWLLLNYDTFSKWRRQARSGRSCDLNKRCHRGSCSQIKAFRLQDLLSGELGAPVVICLCKPQVGNLSLRKVVRAFIKGEMIFKARRSQLESQCQMFTHREQINTSDVCVVGLVLGGVHLVKWGGGVTAALEGLVWCILLKTAFRMLAGVQLAGLWTMLSRACAIHSYHNYRPSAVGWKSL